MLEEGKIQPRPPRAQFNPTGSQQRRVRQLQDRYLKELGQQEEYFFARVTAFCIQCPRCSHVYIVQGAGRTMAGQAVAFSPHGSRLTQLVRMKGRPEGQKRISGWNPRTSKFICRYCGLTLWIGLYAHPVVRGGRSSPPPDATLPWRALMRLRQNLQGILAPFRLPSGQPVNRLLGQWEDIGPFWGDEQMVDSVPLEAPKEPDKS